MAERDISENANLLSSKLHDNQKIILDMIQNGTVLPEILTKLILVVEELAPGMIGTILILDASGKKLTHGAGSHMPDHYNEAVNGIEIGLGVGSCGHAAFTGKPCVIGDMQTHPNWAPFLKLTSPLGLQSCWSAPIFSFDKKVIGTFAMYYKEKREPTLNERKLLDFTSHLATIVIERSRARDAA